MKSPSTSFRSLFSPTFLLAASLFATTACSATPATNDVPSNNGPDAQSNPTCGVPGRAGTTPCGGGAITCAAGQYCRNDLMCEPGCTSDDNCLGNDFCQRSSGNAVGVCTACVSQMPTDSGVIPMTDAAVSPQAQRCLTAVQRAATCGLVDAETLANLRTGCVVNTSFFDILVACVEAAGTNCMQISACGGSISPEDGGTRTDASVNPGTCRVDSECNQTPGFLTHEICSGGLCRPGCRMDDDCGQDWVCDMASRTCFPG